MKKAIDNREVRLFSIGDVARVTGISVFTLRMWERRYGQPASVKLPSGHRRYSAEEMARLKLVKVATDAGEKASQVLDLTHAELDLLAKKYSCVKPTQSVASFAVGQVLEKAKLWDDQAIQQSFETDWQALGPMGFIAERATPLLFHVGQGWENGQVSIATEHFVSSILEKFLIEKWSSLNTNNGDRRLLLCSLEGEDHTFGLHFCAITSVVSGAKVVFLGPSTPESEIAPAAISSSCSGVCLSISPTYDPNLAIKKIKYLRKNLPDVIELIIGGAGAPVDISGVLSIPSCQSLYDWLSSTRSVEND